MFRRRSFAIYAGFEEEERNVKLQILMLFMLHLAFVYLFVDRQKNVEMIVRQIENPPWSWRCEIRKLRQSRTDSSASQIEHLKMSQQYAQLIQQWLEHSRNIGTNSH